MTLISVVIPTYNYAHFLGEAIDSILNQSYADWECIIIDDGSTDDTKEKVNEYIKSDPRIKYFFQTNGGLSSARNKGIELAKGNWIQLLDADDTIDKTKFTLQLALFELNASIDIVTGNYLLMCADGQTLKSHGSTRARFIDKPLTEFISNWENGFSIPIHSFLFRKTCFEKWGNFDKRLKTHEDLSLHLKFAFHGAFYLYHPELVAYYRIHNASMARNYTNMFQGYLQALKYFVNENKPPFGVKVRVQHRYFLEIARMVSFKIMRKNISVVVALQPFGFSLLNITAFLLSPFYIFRKIIFKLIGRRG